MLALLFAASMTVWYSYIELLLQAPQQLSSKSPVSTLARGSATWTQAQKQGHSNRSQSSVVVSDKNLGYCCLKHHGDLGTAAKMRHTAKVAANE